MKEAYSYFSDVHLTNIGLLIFFFWFIGLLVWVRRRGADEHHAIMSLLPLEEEKGVR